LGTPVLERRVCLLQDPSVEELVKSLLLRHGEKVLDGGAT
jgi:hypothetical protein